MSPLLWLALYFAPAAAAATKQLPNFVMVLTDDLGWNTAWRNADHKTPTLDRMVKESMEMERHYVYRYCAPTRGSFLSGRYPFRLSATRANLIPWALLDGINTTYMYLPKKLAEASYVSHHIGKVSAASHRPGCASALADGPSADSGTTGSMSTI
jgi:arylsulfatase B